MGPPDEGLSATGPGQEARSVDLALGVGKILRPWLVGLVVVAAIVAVLLVGANRPTDPSFAAGDYEERRIQVGDKCLLVQVADTPEKRAQGLKERDKIEPYNGMLFVFGQTVQSKFTMAGVKIPLTIGFYDSSGAQVDTKDMAPCPDGQNCPLYESKAPFDNAIEVGQGQLPGGSFTGGCAA